MNEVHGNDDFFFFYRVVSRDACLLACHLQGEEFSLSPFIDNQSNVFEVGDMLRSVSSLKCRRYPLI